MRTLLALTVLPWLTLSSTTVKYITVSPETEVDFKCNATTLPVRWMWFPKHCKCAEESSMKVIYTIDMHGNKTTVQRFKKRLTLRGDPRAGEHALVLSDSVMSDSGTYSCADAKTTVQSYELEFTAGCYHNVQIEIRSGPEAVTLSCSSCDGRNQDFSWMFNRKPVSDLHSIRQTRNLITIQKVTADEEGKWICASMDDPSQFSEYCLDLGSKIQHRRQDCRKNTTQMPGLNKNDSETDGKGGLSDPLKAVIVVALVLIVMVLVTSLWLYRRKRSRRSKQKLADNSAPNCDFSPPVSVGTGQAMTGTATQEEVEVQYASINHGQTKRQQRPLSVEESTVYSAVKIK
ncbi:hypothetical protein AOXY_G27753 [Acipenser oxyrinchus oxyrinchus]|uniref:Ig-like domain-containing protein n=1 Tax=Acipenser oxyrinchus oxyrinchus TaxID=40147 RepID=A0AAD8FVY9_ACIOX|nr:hypothetical protein AOXY_G27753 [Acipenser oxyrinchus oxyrinchus]